MTPTRLYLRPQTFPQKWLGRQAKLELALRRMDREDALYQIRSVLGSDLVHIPN